MSVSLFVVPGVANGGSCSLPYIHSGIVREFVRSVVHDATPLKLSNTSTAVLYGCLITCCAVLHILKPAQAICERGRFKSLKFKKKSNFFSSIEDEQLQ